ncbi:MAG: copper chaperone PCu(A)C [Chloroflexi bacterium]|nr:copper chaperone PCu(A)C [Chloroflexota bacterium]
MKKLALLFLVFALFLAACAAPAQPDAASNGIEITLAKVLLPGGDAMNGMDSTLAAFMTIKNTSTAADRLTGVSADFAEASLHETKMEGDVMKMNAITGIDIPAGQMVELRSGSYHVMFMNLSKQLKVGDTVNLVLEFENAGKITMAVKLTDK